jgi:hypothetical protein
MPKKPKRAAPVAVAVEVVKKERKKNPPRTAFKKGGPNPHAFKSGEEWRGNPGGKVKVGNDLLSKSLRVALADRAPDDVCMAADLPCHSSWSQILARRLLVLAVRGDLQAMDLIHRVTEGTHSRVDLHGFSGLDQDSSDRSVVEIVFIDSDGDGRPRDPNFVLPSKPALPRALPDASD